MALLTKQERRNLDADERRALRAERRAERPKKGIKININWDGLLEKAQGMMLDLIADDVPGPEKMDEVLQMLADEADDFLTWNNLGVVLMERGKTAEAVQIFRKAYAMDDGESTLIRDNLRLALAKSENSDSVPTNDNQYKLVRRGSSDFLIRTAL